MSISRCNICGIPESEWKDGRCYACGYGHYCDMTPDMIIDQRINIWCDKHGQIEYRSVNKDSLHNKAKKCWQKAKKFPGTSSSMRVYWKRKAPESHPSCSA